MTLTKQQHIVHCISCEGTQLSLYLKTKDYFLTKEEFELYKCESCGMVLTSPVPSEKEIERYYKSAEYLSHNSNRKTLTSLVYKFVRKINIKRKFKLINSFNTGSTILDYGCGSGHLLEYFKKKGWKIYGVETNALAQVTASKLNNINISENLDTVFAKENSLDVITLWHVLEHIHNLNEVVNKLSILLNKSGILIIAVPNINSPDSKVFGEFWAGLDVPRHLYHFNAESMEQFLSKHNFKIISALPMKFDAFYVSLLSNKYQGGKFPYFYAIIEGYKSNRRARKNNNYSSMIFVAQKK